MTKEISFIWILAAIGILLILVFTVFFLRYLVCVLADKRTLRYQSDLLEKHCEEVQNMYRQTRGWRHDYHNHIQTMKAHLAMGRLEALEAYLNELDTDLTMVDTVIKTGNVMVDAILNSKISVASSKGIAVEAKAIVPKELDTSLSEVDVCLIVGNLMDNAIEACMKIQQEGERFIRVYMDILKGQLYIYIMNAIGESPKKIGGIYTSTKNRESHGFGLMRIDKVVEKYHGYLERQHEEGVFATEIMLPL
ncbi:MAG: GHKL domain-containing protein [Lachnospiraceae bacterium]|nr:GHKL domain-containing protein [Lachnospiraceae bacterium]